MFLHRAIFGFGIYDLISYLSFHILPGVGRSKKLAKRQSAHKMVQKILTIPAEDETILRSLEDDDEVNILLIEIFGLTLVSNPQYY